MVLNGSLCTFSHLLARIKTFEEICIFSFSYLSTTIKLTGTPFRVGLSDVCEDGIKVKKVCHYKRITHECVHYGK